MAVSPLSLYLHIPFCRVKCTYCDFNTYAGLEALFDDYTRALSQEITAMGRNRQRPPVHTIFIGGGTPTALPVSGLEAILAACRNAFAVAPGAEITSEANPGTVNAPYLRRLRRLGVNRLSLGAQSFQPAELRMLGRLHSAGAIGQTVAAARRAGFDNLNLDVMYGLPGQTLAAWHNTLTRAVALRPEHLSLYSLTLEPDTPLLARVTRGDLPRPDPDLAAEMYGLVDAMLVANGYTQYEISNWCLPGRECRHNLTYWRNRPYLGMGPGAHSFEANRRWWNVKPVPRYLTLAAAAPGSGHPHPALDGDEAISPVLEMGETVILGLRLTREGVSLPAFEARFGQPLAAVFGPAIRKLKALHLLQEETQRLRLTPQARLVSNQVFIHFLPD
ncbi:MAG: radical SAM family heme chaperone HemW [Anaerolineae bacterium]